MTDQNLVGEISKGAVSLDVLPYKYHKYTIVKHVKLWSKKYDERSRRYEVRSAKCDL